MNVYTCKCVVQKKRIHKLNLKIKLISPFDHGLWSPCRCTIAIIALAGLHFTIQCLWLVQAIITLHKLALKMVKSAPCTGHTEESRNHSCTEICTSCTEMPLVVQLYREKKDFVPVVQREHKGFIGLWASKINSKKSSIKCSRGHCSKKCSKKY